MKNIPFFPDYSRQVAKTPPMILKNRFFERNPVQSEDPVAAISRPRLWKFTEVGDGPIRKTFSAPGVFDGDLFTVSGDTLFRISQDDLTDTSIGDISTASTSGVSMAATAPIENSVPAYLFITDGGVLWVYTGDGHASAQLSSTGAIANSDVIRLDDTYYQWTSGSVNSGTPAGSVGSPWLVALGGTTSESLSNMYDAVNASGTAGTTYSTALTAHTTVRATIFTSTDLYFEAIQNGTSGNLIESTETGANISFGGATFSGGGGDQLRQVRMPEDYGAVSVAVINSYVIVVPVQLDEIKGRFYWIEPGENTVDPLNFATAERNPDGVHQVVVFGDMFWLLGQNTTEPWITTGDPTTPVERFKGILFDRGSLEGTAIQIKDALYVIDEDGAAFQIGGGQKRISTPDIEEQIRRAKQQEATAP